MDVKFYTDDKYVPMSQLSNLGEKVVEASKEYREGFSEVVQLDDLVFVHLVETPKLVKNRFIKNIELKDTFDFEAPDHDLILHLAKMIVKGEKIDRLNLEDRDKLIALYKENKNDLTIVTTYLSQNIEKLLENKKVKNLDQKMPELTKYEIAFIKNNNDLDLTYSINDFQNQNKTSYETSRKALEKLANLSLFNKDKVGKKFVYRPTKQLRQILKGGA